jgi:hypothetical protein
MDEFHLPILDSDFPDPPPIDPSLQPHPSHPNHQHHHHDHHHHHHHHHDNSPLAAQQSLSTNLNLDSPSQLVPEIDGDEGLSNHHLEVDVEAVAAHLAAQVQEVDYDDNQPT